MTDYTKTVNFAAKDSLPSGDSGKIIRGTEFDTEFNNISTAIATKADEASPTFTGTASFNDVTATGTVTTVALSVTGNTTLGDAATDTVTFTADVASNLIPSTTNTYDLGTSSEQWKDLYIDGKAYVDAIELDGTDITATAAEINILDGVTVTTDELNILDGVTANTTELNLLDGVTELTSYVSGDWTPEVADATTGGNVATTSSSVGRYVKVGNFVQVNMIITNINTTGLTGGNQIFVRNLPFTARDTTPTSFYLGVAQLYRTGASSSGTLWVPTLYDNQSVIRFQAVGDNSIFPDSLTVSELTSGEADFYVTLQYEAASS